MIQVRIQRSRHLAFSAILFGLFTVVSDQGIIIIALPTIANHFGSDLPTTQWVPIGYTLAISIILLPMGRLADLVGRKPVYVTGFAIFSVTGIMAGFAPSIPTLIAVSTLHGLGAGMTQGTAMAMVVATFPQSERGKVLGIYMGVVGAGSVFGPAAGGVVVGALGMAVGVFRRVGARPDRDSLDARIRGIRQGCVVKVPIHSDSTGLARHWRLGP